MTVQFATLPMAALFVFLELSACRGGPCLADRPEISRVESFEAEAEIILRKGPVPNGEPRAFEARGATARLGPTIERSRS